MATNAGLDRTGFVAGAIHRIVPAMIDYYDASEAYLRDPDPRLRDRLDDARDSLEHIRGWAVSGMRVYPPDRFVDEAAGRVAGTAVRILNDSAVPPMCGLGAEEELNRTIACAVRFEMEHYAVVLREAQAASWWGRFRAMWTRAKGPPGGGCREL